MDILIAEDSITSRKLLKCILIKMNFNVIEAVDGLDAWNKLQIQKPPQIALIDWDMPNLNGIELVERIRNIEKDTSQYTYIIMITSKTDEKDANIGFEVGVDNFLTKPIDHKELSINLKIARRIIKQQNYLYDIQEKLALQLSKQKNEIMKAQEIQLLLNTSELPLTESINLSALYNPSQEMGGDFFNIIKTPRGNIAIIMVDCTGHGLEASMYATLLKSICDRHIYLLDSPKYLSSFVQMVNIDAAGYITTDQYPVMFVSVYEPESSKFYYSSANGEHPYLVRNNNVYPLARARGMHLGYNTETQYMVKSFIVKDDDIILFYSDAIIEIDNVPWDRENDIKLKDELAKMGKNLNQDKYNLMNFILEHSGSTLLDDDLSLIFLQKKEVLFDESKINKMTDIEIELKRILEILFTYNYTKDQIDRVSIAFKELLLNAIIHGNKRNENKYTQITYKISCNKITITIKDQGNGFNESDIPDPTNYDNLQKAFDEDNEAEYAHGRGIWLARKLTDYLLYTDNGRQVTINIHKDKVYTSNNYKIPIDNIQLKG